MRNFNNYGLLINYFGGCRLSDACECTELCPTLCHPWTVAHQAPPSMEFSRQEYCSGLPFPTPDNLPNPRIEPVSLTSPALACGYLTALPYVYNLGVVFIYSLIFLEADII